PACASRAPEARSRSAPEVAASRAARRPPVDWPDTAWRPGSRPARAKPRPWSARRHPASARLESRLLPPCRPGGEDLTRHRGGVGPALTALQKDDQDDLRPLGGRVSREPGMRPEVVLVVFLE